MQSARGCSQSKRQMLHVFRSLMSNSSGLTMVEHSIIRKSKKEEVESCLPWFCLPSKLLHIFQSEFTPSLEFRDVIDMMVREREVRRVEDLGGSDLHFVTTAGMWARR